MCVCVQFDIDENLVSRMPISLRTNQILQHTTQNLGMYLCNVPWGLSLVHKYFAPNFRYKEKQQVLRVVTLDAGLKVCLISGAALVMS